MADILPCFLGCRLNGSDPRHQAILASFEGADQEATFFPGADVESRFRETDELRYSLRSAKAALGDHLRTSHLVSADYWPSGLPGDLPSGRLAGGRAVPPTVEIPGVGQSDVFHIETGLARHGQVPQWLDLRHPGVKTGDGARAVDRRSPPPALRVHHDWSIYSRLENAVPRNRPESPYSALASTEQQLQWKLSVLPTFNSGAKEAAMGLEVTDLAEAFFYSNDDYWMGGNLTTADFSSPLYGPVFFTARYSMVDPVEYIEDGLGEMPSYKYTAWLLGQRFGSRKRSYIHHVHKTYVKPLVEEAQLMFGDELGRTASYRFRGEGQTVNHQLLTYNFVIERHREALLWSYLVARIDKNADGVYSSEELEAAFGDLGLSSKPRVATNVSLPVRDTLLDSTIKHSFSESRFPEPGEAKYVFSSQDGYALAELKAARKFDNSWPDYSEPTGANAGKEDEPAATFQWDTCWHTGQKWTPVKLFKHMAFANTDCGDYLVTLLVALSGRKGLSAFLPHEDAVFPAQDAPDPVLRTETTPHLPLNERWQDGDFSLAAVARNTGWAGLSSRLFAMMLIQRYAYTMGMVPLKFDMITTLKSAKETFDRYKEKGRGTYPFLAINDDMTGDEVRETQVLFLDWMEDMWPAEQYGLPYERT